MASSIGVESKAHCNCSGNSFCRASELPIYSEEECDSEGETKETGNTEEAVIQYMENVILKSQKKYEIMCNELNQIKETGMEAFHISKSKVDCKCLIHLFFQKSTKLFS